MERDALNGLDRCDLLLVDPSLFFAKFQCEWRFVTSTIREEGSIVQASTCTIPTATSIWFISCDVVMLYIIFNNKKMKLILSSILGILDLVLFYSYLKLEVYKNSKYKTIH